MEIKIPTPEELWQRSAPYRSQTERLERQQRRRENSRTITMIPGKAGQPSVVRLNGKPLPKVQPSDFYGQTRRGRKGVRGRKARKKQERLAQMRLQTGHRG